MKKSFTDSHDLQWSMKGKRTNRTSSPPWQPTADDYPVAETLLLLSTSGGGFCSCTPIAAVPITILPSTTPQQLSSSSFSAITSAAETVTRLAEVESPDTLLPETKDEHPCLMCGKVFKSHQALGGHMTCHRVKTENNTEKRPKVHECSLCHQIFPTGCALGGHKRKHYQGELHPST